MNIRVADSSSSNNFTSRINAQRNRLNILQERLATGKRINRPSDDPSGTEIVLNLRTSQTQIEQFQRSAEAVSQKLTAADDTLSGYENILDRVRTLVSQGMTGTATQQVKNAVATEIESLRSRLLSIANTKNGDQYVFGGTRQNAPPYDPTTGVPANTPASVQFVQIEPGANAVASGVTAETVFGDSNSTIFNDLTNAVNALRGTGNQAADDLTLQNTMNRLIVYSDLAATAHATIGANMNAAEVAYDSLTSSFLSLDERASAIENADFAETAVGLADAERALEATLQVAARGRRSLFDFLG